MGKGRNKNKEKDSYTVPRGHRDEGSDSDDSVSTHLTFDDDLRSVQGDDVDDVDTIMDTLSEHIENASHKNISIRLAALKHLHLAFTSQFVPDFVMKWKSTLLDIVMKNLKKTDDECYVSATLLAQMSIQIGEEISDEISEPMAAMRTVVMNNAKPENLRAACALSIALVTHLSCEDDTAVSDNLKALRHAWTSFKLTASSSRLFSAALSGWALLLQSADHSSLATALSEYSKLTNYLEADNLDVRIACGETIAYIYELARGTLNPTYRFPNHAQIVEVIAGISGECTKGKAKKDRRVQRFSFRQIHASIVNNDPPSVTIKFSKQSLTLDSCSSKLFYDLCCEVLHGGMMRHLENNSFLREIFDLPPVALEKEKVSKIARMAYHDAASKYRNQARGKQRDKRAVIL